MIYPVETKINAVQEYQHGDSFRVIGQRYGADHKTVRRWIRNAGGAGRDRIDAVRLAMRERRGIRVSPETEFKKGQQPWNAGTAVPYFDKTIGYFKISVPGRGEIKYHRFVMEQHLGRKLLESEIVHHIDGNVLNNDIENLQLFESMSAHSTHHWRVKNGRRHR